MVSFMDLGEHVYHLVMMYMDERAVCNLRGTCSMMDRVWRSFVGIPAYFDEWLEGINVSYRVRYNLYRLYPSEMNGYVIRSKMGGSPYNFYMRKLMMDNEEEELLEICQYPLYKPINTCMLCENVIYSNDNFNELENCSKDDGKCGICMMCWMKIPGVDCEKLGCYPEYHNNYMPDEQYMKLSGVSDIFKFYGIEHMKSELLEE